MLKPIDLPGHFEARLLRLDKRCQKLQLALYALSLCLVIVVLGGAAALNRFKTIEAEEIVLRDAAGKKRGWFGVGEDGNVRLSILDRDENEKVMLGIAPDGAAIVYLSKQDRAVTVGVDGNGVPMIELTGEEKGGASFFYRPDLNSGLYLRDKQGRDRLSAVLAPGGRPQFFLYDSDDKMRLALGAGKDESYSLLFLDEREDQRLALGLSGDRKAYVDLFEHPKRARMGMSAGPDGVCEFSIQDQFGKPRVGFQLFEQGTETLFRMDDGTGAHGITLNANSKGLVYQKLISKVKNTAVSLGIDEQGVSSMTFAEKGARPRLGLSVKPGSHALFSAWDERGHERARAGVDEEGEGEMRTFGEQVDGDRAALERPKGKDPVAMSPFHCVLRRNEPPKASEATGGVAPRPGR